MEGLLEYCLRDRDELVARTKNNYLAALYQRSAEPTGARQGDMAMQSAKRTTVHSRQSFIGSDGRRARRSVRVREELTGRDRSRDNALSARLENPLCESQSMRLFGFTRLGLFPPQTVLRVVAFLSFASSKTLVHMLRSHPYNNLIPGI